MGKKMTISVTLDIDAPADKVYDVIADYHQGHRSIVSPKFFQDWHVEQGGHGAGTVLTYTAATLGTRIPHRAVVSEPEPGRVLVETEETLHTTFTVDPLGANRARVNFTTVVTPSKGVQGAIERLVMPPLLKPLYKEEIRQLGKVAREINSPVSTTIAAE
jgi:hypothetical protein